MDEPTLDPVYLKQLKPSFKKLFIQFIKPNHVLHVFHTYNIHILTEFDLGEIAAETTNHGPIAGSILLFERLVLYKGWYPCLLKVLCDRGVCLSHVAQEMEEIKGSLDDEILQEESDDQIENNEKGLAGLSLDTNLKDPVLEKRLLKKKVELEKQKTELDKLMKMYNELKVSHEEMKQIKEKQKTELDKATEMYNELKVSHQELLHVKEKQKTELDKVTEMHNKLKVSYKELQLKETIQKESADIKEQLNLAKKANEKLMRKVFSKDLNLLIVGKVGAGKSALGNSILRREAFRSYHCAAHGTKNYQIEYGEYKYGKLMVVDTPGMCPVLGLKKSTDQIRQAVTIQSEGYHALIYVVRFGGRFTREDEDCLNVLKTILGDNCIKQFGILAVTFGDCFKHYKNNIKFEEWCREEGFLKDLIEEFEQRIVLFDNLTSDEAEKEGQLDQLIALVDCLQAKRSTFTAKDLRAVSPRLRKKNKNIHTKKTI